MTFYCVKCKSKKEIENYEEIKTKNNHRAAKTVCPDCGIKLLRFLPKDPATINTNQ